MFVRDVYDRMLPKLKKGYSDFRWNDTPVSRFHYCQSRRALLAGLGAVPTKLDRALEIGGGGGAWTPFFAPRTAELDFLDISEQMLLEAKAALADFSGIRYIQSDFLEWEPPTAVYDLAVSIRNIEYMRDKSAVLDRLARALKKGGTLILSTKSPEYDWGGYFDKRPLHSGQIRIAELLDLLSKSGFTILQVYPAIVGKLIRFAPMRFLWHTVQWLSFALPSKLRPLFLLKYISESFLIVARRT